MVRFPRIRGGDPQGGWLSPQRGQFSPHPRGWSCFRSMWPSVGFVFPASAGVILSHIPPNSKTHRFPRTCGGDPLMLGFAEGISKFSPHLRGGDPELYKYFKWKRRAIRFGSNAGNTDKINILSQRNIKMYSNVLSYRIEYVSMKE